MIGLQNESFRCRSAIGAAEAKKVNTLAFSFELLGGGTGDRERASATVFSFPGRYKTLKSYALKRKIHLANLAIGWAVRNSDEIAEWSVITTNGRPFLT